MITVHGPVPYLPVSPPNWLGKFRTLRNIDGRKPKDGQSQHASFEPPNQATERGTWWHNSCGILSSVKDPEDDKCASV